VLSFSIFTSTFTPTYECEISIILFNTTGRNAGSATADSGYTASQGWHFVTLLFSLWMNTAVQFGADPDVGLTQCQPSTAQQHWAFEASHRSKCEALPLRLVMWCRLSQQPWAPVLSNTATVVVCDKTVIPAWLPASSMDRLTFIRHHHVERSSSSHLIISLHNSFMTGAMHMAGHVYSTSHERIMKTND